MLMRRGFSIVIALLAYALTGNGSAISSSTSGAWSGGPAGYDVAVQTSEAGGGATWTYTLTRSSAKAKAPGHFILDFDACGAHGPTIASIVSATVNGVNWLDQIEATEGATGCGVPSRNFVKFDNLPEADTYVIEFTLDDVYPLMDSTGWLKSGTVCSRNALPGPGCKGYLRTSAMEADPRSPEAPTLISTPTCGDSASTTRNIRTAPAATAGTSTVSTATSSPMRFSTVPCSGSIFMSIGHRRRPLQLEHRRPPAQRDEVDHQQLDMGEGSGQLG